MRITAIKWFTYLFILHLIYPSLLFAQNTSPKPSSLKTSIVQPLTLNEAVSLALYNYPGIRAARSQADAARAGIDLSRTAYLPQAQLFWQENRATANNIFGLLLPQTPAAIPSISGPALGTKSFESGWGSAGGILFSWEPFDFGLRKANVAVAHAAANKADAELRVTQLDVATSAAEEFILLLAAEQAVRVAQANAERMRAFAKAVHVLVDKQLRAGVDASRADAEVATAENQLILAQQSAEINRAKLAEALGIAGASVTIRSGPLLERLPLTHIPVSHFESHPRTVAQDAAIKTVQSRRRALDRAYYPKFELQGVFFGRGTSALLQGGFEGGSEGLFPDTPNWAAGLSISFPAFNIFPIRSHRRIEAGNEATEKARYDQIIQKLETENAEAKTLVDTSLQIMENSRIRLKAARDAELKARTQYNVQLATVTDVVESQKLLTQAEIDDAVSRLGVWRAMLAVAKARGDIEPFLQQVTNASVSRKR